MFLAPPCTLLALHNRIEVSRAAIKDTTKYILTGTIKKAQNVEILGSGHNNVYDFHYVYLLHVYGTLHHHHLL